MDKTDLLAVFDVARKLYPHRKLGNETEFNYFVKTHKDWKKALSLLANAIATQIEWRKAAKKFNSYLPFHSEKRIFIPAWKDFKSWICNRYWELELPKIENQTISGLMIETPEYKELIDRVVRSFELDLVVPDIQARKVKMLKGLKNGT
jgi:hypothetical protein